VTLRLYNEYGRTYLFDLRGNNYVVDAFHIGNVLTSFLLYVASLTKRFPVHSVFGQSPASQMFFLSFADTCTESQLCAKLLDEERRYQ
jgi:hypothetical protein